MEACPGCHHWARELAALGLVAGQKGSGGRTRLGRISRKGGRYLRWLLVAGAMAVIRQGRKTNFAGKPWLAKLVADKPTKKAAVALASKNARIAWALMRSGECHRPAQVRAA